MGAETCEGKKKKTKKNLQALNHGFPSTILKLWREEWARKKREERQTERRERERYCFVSRINKNYTVMLNNVPEVGRRQYGAMSIRNGFLGS